MLPSNVEIKPNECYLLCKYSDACPLKYVAFSLECNCKTHTRLYGCEELLALYEIFQEIGLAKKENKCSDKL